MNAVVLGRGIADGWRGLLIAAVSVTAMLFLGLWVYQDIDLSIYDALPEGVRAVIGIPEDADPSLMAYNEMLAAIGALAFVGVAIAIGARAIAGEEERRTLHLVLSTPVSRLRFAASKAAALILLLIVGGLILWGLAELAPVVLGVGVGKAHVAALMIHLVACALFHGALAFAIGAATGRRAPAAGGAALVMVLGWLGVGLLPMWKAGSADWIPWNWFNGSRPLVNGVDGGDLALLLGGTVVLLVLGVWAFERRELRLAQAGSGILARLRSKPRLARFLTPAGSTSLFGIRLAQGRPLLTVVVYVVGLVMGLVMPFTYNVMKDALVDFSTSFPTSMLLMFGGGEELVTPAGFLQVETFGMMAPIGAIVVAVAAAAAGVAGEERSRRLAAVLSAPVGRSRIYWTVAAAVAEQVAVVAVSLFLLMWLGVALAGVDLDIGHLMLACLQLMLMSWCFGALALMLSAATGSSSVAVWGATGVAVASYFGYTLLNVAGHGSAAWWSPFRPYLYGPPLMQGIAWWQPVWLATTTLVLLMAGLPLFLRRDLRL